jgi:hypothetical protein
MSGAEVRICASTTMPPRADLDAGVAVEVDVRSRPSCHDQDVGVD